MGLPDLVSRLRFVFEDQGSSKASAAARNFESSVKGAHTSASNSAKSYAAASTTAHTNVASGWSRASTASQSHATTVASSAAKSGSAWSTASNQIAASSAKAGESTTRFGSASERASALAATGAGKAHGAFDKLSGQLAGRLGPASGVASSALEKASAMMGGMSSKALVATAGTAALAAGFGLLAAKGVSTFVAMTAEVRKYKMVAGGSAEDASRMVATARAMGVETDVLSKGMSKLARNTFENSDKLKGLGIQVAYNSKGNVDMGKTLLAVGDAYKAASSDGQKAAIVQTAFGKGGEALRPILGKNREEIEAFWATAQKRGQIFNQGDLDNGLKFSKALRDLKQSVNALTLSAGSGLVPALTGVFTSLTRVVDAGRQIGILKVLGVTTAAGLAPLRIVLEVISYVLGRVGAVAHAIAAGFSWVSRTAKEFEPLRDAIENAGKGLEKLGRLAAAVGGFVKGLSQHLGLVGKDAKDAGSATDKAASSTDKLGDEASDAAKELKAEQDALNKVLDAAIKLIGGTLGLESAQNSLTDAVADLAEKQRSGTATAKDLRDADLSAREAANSYAAAALNKAEADAEASGRTLSAAERQDIFRGGLERAAGQMNGPQRQAVLNYAGTLNTIPGEKNTNLKADPSNAHSNIGGVQGRLGQLPAEKNTRVTADTGQAESGLSRVLNLLSRLPGPIGTGAGFLDRVIPGRAHGGPVAAGRPYVVGEHRAELFVPDVSGYIRPSVPSGARSEAGPSPSRDGRAGRAALIIEQLHVHPSPGMDETALAQKVARELARKLR